MTSSVERPPTRRPVGRIVVAVIFLVLAINALAQVAAVAFGGSNDPSLLTLLQLVVGSIALATAWGSWSGARWSPAAAALYGVVTGAMIASLAWLLHMPREAVGGIVLAGAVVLLFSLALAWYLRRSLRTHARVT
jgi:hypothetical protein